VDERFLTWRFGTPLLGYRVIEHDDAVLIVRGRRRGNATELAVVAQWGDPHRCDRVAGRAAREAATSYAIRLGSQSWSTGFLPLPGGGPVLTWRRVTDAGVPPLSNWALTLGDIELF
jgi:hypothetical protein